MIEQYIEKLRPHVLELFAKDSSGHDIGHLERTMRTALHIQEKEGGDRIVIGIAAFLHDVHRIMQNETGKFVSPKDSLDTVRKILDKADLELSDEQVNKICYCIEFHEEYNWNGNNVDELNTQILQDADNLEAIGAIGIGRAFIYCGAHSIPMYNENIPLNENNDYIEDEGDNESTIHHFHHKLFKLGDNMNTKTGKEMAIKRIDFMKEFTKVFFDEWNGNY